MSTDSLRPKVLVIDDDVDFADDLALILSTRYRVDTVSSADEGLSVLRLTPPDIVLLDVDFGSGMNGYQFLEKIPADETSPPVIMLTGDREVQSVVKAVKMGAFHYVCKPPEMDELVNLINRSLKEMASRRHVLALQSEVGRLTGFDEFICGDAQTMYLLNQVDRIAPTGATALITGECGTGKEMIARRIHAASERSKGPFLGMNCAAVPADLIESELFGHERGAFTGAHNRRAGKFELAAGGTIFLDEIGDSPDLMQVKLLRVLEERCFFRVGGESSIAADVRVVAATSRDLEEDVKSGKFRPELFYRLNVVRLHLLPLRDRPADVMPLALHFLVTASAQYGRGIVGMSASAQKMLIEHDWPGNVRELRNVMERAVISCRGMTILPSDLSLVSQGAANSVMQNYDEAKSRALYNFKMQYVSNQLRASGGNITLAAENSGMLRQAFQRMVRDLDLDLDDYRDADEAQH